MKLDNLNAMNLNELSAKEAEDTQGGIFAFLLGLFIGVIAGILASSYGD